MLSESVITEKLFELFLSKGMLGEFETEIKHLIELCSDDEEISILFHTLTQMTILDQRQLNFGLKLMASYVMDKAKEYDKLAVVAMAYDSNADGSQQILQMLKTELPRGLNIALFNTVPSYLRKMNDYPQFVLIDDFSGTGATVINRVQHISKDARHRCITAIGSVCLIAAMENAIQEIKSSGIDVRVFKELKAGISGYFSGQSLENAKERMLRLESELNPAIDGNNLPSFGYGGAEALYFVHRGNAPNSNFPIFWWPEDKTGRERKTIMKRHEL